MGQTGGHSCLAEKTAETHGVVGQFRTQNLERNGTSQKCVFGKINLTHSTFSEKSHDPVVRKNVLHSNGTSEFYSTADLSAWDHPVASKSKTADRCARPPHLE